jgi:serine/threonine-protein kinase/endoribonuclease IRE1
MLRRPPGHVAPQRKYLLALALILLPWLPLADAQQQHQRQPSAARHRSPAEHDQHAPPNLAATTVTAQEAIESPRVRRPRKLSTVESDDDDDETRPRILARPSKHNLIPDDARAHALAPDLSVRAPPPSQYRGPSPGAGLSQHVARSLEDWEVEDFVLLATVDGDLYASDRKTGQERWHFKADHPMVETRHFRTNRSVLDDDYDPIDHYIWVVEPTRDGELYLWRPNEQGAGLAKMALTMKKVVEELSPWNDKDNGVVYLGDKKTTMVTLNAATGTIIKQFGSSGSYVNKVDSESCFKPNALADGEEECSEDRTITLGRTEYTVSIQRFDGSPIASLKYSEWVPNTQDNDLIQQNLITKDSRYVTGQHDGKVYGFEYGRFSEERPVFTKTLASPVARVFDVLHRWGSAPGMDPELIALPQPPLPASDEDSARLRSERVFINQTEEGSWYALSGSRYPLILSAPVAPIHRVDWWRIKEAWDLLPESQKSRALVGTHQLPDGLGAADRIQAATRLLLDPPRVDPQTASDNETPRLLPAPQPEPSTIINTAKKVPVFVVSRIFDLVSNPAAIVIAIVTVWFFYKDRLLNVNPKSSGKADLLASRIEVNPTLPDPTREEAPATAEVAEPKAQVAPADPAPGDAAPVEAIPEQNPEPPAAAREPLAVAFAEPPEVNGEPAEGADNPGEAVKKKKGHRGRRGGVKHRKGNRDKRENSQSRDDDPPQESVEEVINKAKTLVREPKLEPDIITVAGDADEVSGHILKMGSLEVNEAEQLGTGSNGTIVFAGKWDGRDVAVKRMLVQFNEIASQETRLLRESDDHPNGRRHLPPAVRRANRDSHPLLRPARARGVPLHCAGALPGLACRHRPKAPLL